MSRKRDLKGRDSVVVSDDDEQMVPTEPADPPLAALPAQGGLLAPLTSSAAQAVASPASPTAVPPASVPAPQSESDMLGAIRSLVEVTNRGRAETNNLAAQVGTVLKRVEEQGRQMDSMANLLQDYERRTRAVEDRCRSLESKLSELTRTVAQHRSSSASPRLSSPATGAGASQTDVDPLLAVLSWPSPLERSAADVSLRRVLGLAESHVLIFPRKYSTMALFKAKTTEEFKTVIDASREGRLKLDGQRLWARPSESKLQQRGGFLLRKSAEFLRSCGCERVEKDSRVVYVGGLEAIKVRDGKLLKGSSWPETLAGSFDALLAAAESWG